MCFHVVELRQRELDRERQKREWEMKERQAEEQRLADEERMRRQQEEMQLRMHHQEEEMRRRQQENTLFMQVVFRIVLDPLGYVVAQLVEALHKLEGCGLESCWGHWDFLLAIDLATLWPWD